MPFESDLLKTELRFDLKISGCANGRISFYIMPHIIPAIPITIIITPVI